ncbi:MAG: polymer-forming cytoskeletal protein [Gemmatimonadota bacterium]|nr:MAG: polymer-forming cytoskeletal protein [Gemmatimonadota bacterium]
MAKRFRLVLLIAGLFPASLAAQTGEKEIVQTAVTLGDAAATLDLELATGRSLQVRLADGLIYISGNEAGRYTPGGTLESAWRTFLRGAAEGGFESALSDFATADLQAESSAATRILETLEPLRSAAPGTTAAVAAEVVSADAPALPQQVDVPGTARLEEVVVGGLVIELSEIEGLARALGRVGLSPTLSRALDGDLKPPVRIVIDAEEYRLAAGSSLNNTLILVQSESVIEGTVAADVIVAEGSLQIAPTARIEGDVVAINATVDNLGTVVGSLREGSHLGPVVVAPRPPGVGVRIGGPSVVSRVFGGLGSLAKTIAMYLLFAFLGALVVYFFRGNLEAVSDTVSHSFGRSFLAGLAAEVLFLPVGLVIVVLIITAIALPFYLLGFVFLSLLGYVAVAHAAGENLTRHRFPSWGARLRRSNSYYYVLNGLGVLLALFAGAAITEMAYPLLGWAHDLLIASAWILTWVAATSGLGASVLSRAGTRRTYARPHELPELPIGDRTGDAPYGRSSRARQGAWGDEL